MKLIFWLTLAYIIGTVYLLIGIVCCVCADARCGRAIERFAGANVLRAMLFLYFWPISLPLAYFIECYCRRREPAPVPYRDL